MRIMYSNIYIYIILCIYCFFLVFCNFNSFLFFKDDPLQKKCFIFSLNLFTRSQNVFPAAPCVCRRGTEHVGADTGQRAGNYRIRPRLLL